MNGASVFISGGAGFLGARLSRALAERGARCWVYDNLHPQVHGANACPVDLGSSTEFIVGDVTDAAALSQAVRRAQPDVVFHLAAETGTGQSAEKPAAYCEVNVTGTAHLVEAMKAAPKAVRRLVLASSRAIYGEGAWATPDGRIVTPGARRPEAMAAGRFDPELEGAGPLEPRPTCEDAPPSPASVYASTKLMQEYIVAQTRVGAPWTACILRFQNVYGPGQSLRNPYTGVLSIFADKLRRGEALNIYEDGRIVRDFVYVDDVVDALIRAGQSDRDGCVLNIGSGRSLTILEAAETMARAAGRSPDAIRISGDFRPGDVRFAVADVARAGAVLGWRPVTSFETGVQALMQWAAAEPLAPIVPVSNHGASKSWGPSLQEA